jgi:protein phosphatase 1L
MAKKVVRRRKIVAKKAARKIAVKKIIQIDETVALRAEIALLRQQLLACQAYLQPQAVSLQSGECVTQSIGKRPYQEDRYVVTNITLPSQERAKLWALFDGHGGTAVSELLVKQFPKAIAMALVQAGGTNVEAAIRAACGNLDAQIKDRAGSTAVAILLYHDTLYTINVGDSRAVIRLATGTVIATVDQKFVEGRVYNPNAFVFGGYLNIRTKTGGVGQLGVGAAFGDIDYKEATDGAFNAIPVVNAYPLSRAFNPINAVLASDGLWDVVSNDEVAPLLQHPKPNLCQELVKLAQSATQGIILL